MRARGRGPASLALGATLVLAPAPALAESTTVEIDPNASSLHLGEPVVLKNAPLAAVMSLALPLAASTPLLFLKPGSLSTGLYFGAPVLASAGSLYAGDPWHGLAVGITGPLCVLAGFGAGLALGKAGGLADTALAGYGTTGMQWGYGLFLAWAATDAYVTAELQNKKALARAGIHDAP